jgi:hypothetical protein
MEARGMMRALEQKASGSPGGSLDAACSMNVLGLAGFITSSNEPLY